VRGRLLIAAATQTKETKQSAKVAVVASRVKMACFIGDKIIHNIRRSSKKERPLLRDLIILIILILEMFSA
jgi:hypothetical protein